MSVARSLGFISCLATFVILAIIAIVITMIIIVVMTNTLQTGIVISRTVVAITTGTMQIVPEIIFGEGAVAVEETALVHEPDLAPSRTLYRDWVLTKNRLIPSSI